MKNIKKFEEFSTNEGKIHNLIAAGIIALSSIGGVSAYKLVDKDKDSKEHYQDFLSSNLWKMSNEDLIELYKKVYPNKKVESEYDRKNATIEIKTYVKNNPSQFSVEKSTNKVILNKSNYKL